MQGSMLLKNVYLISIITVLYTACILMEHGKKIIPHNFLAHLEHFIDLLKMSFP